MSAAKLQQAAQVMRARAEAAIADGPAPWTAGAADELGSSEVRDGKGICLAYSETGHNASFDGVIAEHVASWHPAVALAVADWLEQASRGACCDDCMVDPSADPWRAQALDVANTYLAGLQ